MQQGLPLPALTHKLQLAKPAVEHIFLPGKPSTGNPFLHKLDCSSWPQEQSTTQEGRDEAHKTSQLQLKPQATAPSQPRPTKKWH